MKETIFSIVLVMVVANSSFAQQGLAIAEAPAREEASSKSNSLNYRLEYDPLGGQRLDLLSLIVDTRVWKGHPDHPSYLFDITDEQVGKIRKIYREDHDTYSAIASKISEQLHELLRQGYRRGNEEVDALYHAYDIAKHEYYSWGESRNRRIAQVLDESQLEALRRGAKARGVVEFGGLLEVYETAMVQHGLAEKKLTSEQSQRVYALVQQYQRKLLDLNAEFTEEMLDLLPDEEKDALTDTLGIRGLEKTSKDNRP